MTPHRLLAAGAVGSALLALGATGVGALPADSWGLLRGATAPALALCVLGVLLLGAAWWRARDRDLGFQLRASGLWALPLLLAPPLASRDLYAYAGQAALVAAGRDPYAEGPGALPGPLADGVDDVWLDAPAPYGPLWMGLAGLAVRGTGPDVVPALLALRLLAVAGVALTAWALVRLAPALGTPPSRAVWLGVANPLVLVHFVGGGHNDALMVGLLTAGVAVAFCRRTPRAVVLGAVLVTTAALVKVPALAALAYLPLALAGAGPRLRAALLAGAAAALTAGAVTTVSGVGWGWLGSLDAGRARLSLFSPLTGLGTAVGAVDLVLAAGLVLAALVCAGLLCAADRLGPVRTLGLTLLAVSVLLPVVQPWYVLWGVALLAAAAGSRAAAALGAGCLVLCLLIMPSGRSVVRPPLYGLPTVLAAAAAAVVLRRSSNAAPDGESSSTPTSSGSPP